MKQPIEQLNIKQFTPMSESFESIINKINELVEITNQLLYLQMNPLEVIWHLQDTPEEERGKQAALWDYLEEDILKEDKNG